MKKLPDNAIGIFKPRLRESKDKAGRLVYGVSFEAVAKNPQKLWELLAAAAIVEAANSGQPILIKKTDPPAEGPPSGKKH